MMRWFIILGLISSAWAALPCDNSSASCDTGLQSTTFAGSGASLTRYWDAYIPKSLPASNFPVMFVLPGACLNCGWTYNVPQETGPGLFKTFADLNGVAIVWMYSTCLDAGGSSPYPLCTNTTSNINWIFNVYTFGTQSLFESADFGSGGPDDLGYLSSLITTSIGWGASSSKITASGHLNRRVVAQLLRRPRQHSQPELSSQCRHLRWRSVR